jgi:hypothetical protein
MKPKRLIFLSFILMGLIWTCVDRHPTGRGRSEAVTFNNQVVRLLQQKCQVCHHDGDIAPFSLVTYSQAKLFAEAMREATESGEMPPWKAGPDCAALDGVTRLTAEEREIIARWVAEGTAEGTSADLLPPLKFDESWPLGEPDVVLRPDRALQVNLGDDLYRCFSLPSSLRGDRFITAIDVKPTARNIVHHAIVYLDTNGESQRLDDSDPLPGFQCPNDSQFAKTSPVFWWVPGQTSQFETDDAGWLIPKGANLVLKIHYHVHHGDGGLDQTAVGLYFARRPVIKQLRVLSLINQAFTIPAGDPNYAVSASSPQIVNGGDFHVLGIAPHMQLLGHDMQIEAHSAEGSQCLIEVDDWDAHWQRLYQFKEPSAIAAGAHLRLTAHYNNSRSNRENPNFPLKDIGPGEQTTDETCIAFVKYTLDSEQRELSSPEVSLVFVDSDGRMVVKGRAFSPGADILIDGERVHDSLNHRKSAKAPRQITSSEDWNRLVPAGKRVSVSVLNTDGVRSVAISFLR